MAHSSPVTVLYVAWAPFYSGAERALVVLLENLDRARVRPIVAVGTDGDLASELRARDLEVVHLPIVYSSVRGAGPWLAAVGRFARLARRARVRLVHANDAPSFQPAGYAARLLGIPAVTHVRFPSTRAGFEWFLKPGFRRALFVSADLRQSAVAEARTLFEGRSDVVYDGVHVPDPVDAAARADLRAELGLPQDKPVVGMTGQVAEVKGIWDLIEAAGILAGRSTPVCFAVLGDDLQGKGALRLEAQRVVRERGLSEHVRFLGFRPNAPRLLPAFDLVAVPSHIEPLGNATLEAMAAGLPVVGSRVGGIPEMIVDGVTGRLVPPRNPAALAEAVEQLIRDPEAMRGLGRAGRDRALEVFGTKAHVDRVMDVYDTVLN